MHPQLKRRMFCIGELPVPLERFPYFTSSFLNHLWIVARLRGLWENVECERAYQAFPRTRRITVRASGEWTAARHLIGFPLTNRISPTPVARRMRFLRAISALDWAVIHDQHLEFVSPKLVFFSPYLVCPSTMSYLKNESILIPKGVREMYKLT